MDKNKIIASWLLICCICILCMVGIGGLTRLTKSGLSIVEWKPITGIIPPLNHEAWQAEFNKYQQIPEFQMINHQMDLKGFKAIYYMEYFHRLFARITFLTCFLPLFIFYYLKYFDRRYFLKLLAIFSLIIVQGLIGWLMVKTGLKYRTNVSEFWLSFHLLFALLIFSLVLWQFFRVYYNSHPNINKNFLLKFTTFILIPLQIGFGGLVAGIHILGFCFENHHSLCMLNLLDLISYDHSLPYFYIHRLLGITLALIIGFICAFNFIKKTYFIQSFSLLFLLATQIVIGLLLVFLTPDHILTLKFALLHQLNGFFIEAILLNLLFHRNRLG